MSSFALTCCSTADMPISFFENRNIRYASFHYIINGTEYDDDLYQSMDADTFYKKIEDGALPTTSQVNVEQYMQLFTPFVKDGKDVVHITLSSGISGSINSAMAAKKIIEQEYPGRTIYVIDSLGASSGYGMLVTIAADMRDAGKSAVEIYEWFEDNKLTLHHWFFSSDLRHYKRGGRISATSAAIGGLLNICPLMNMSYDGKLIPRTKIRGKKKVINEIVNKMQENAKGGLEYNGRCYISHSACFKDARAVADLIESRFPKLNGKVLINPVGAVIGSHTGPGTIALFFEGNKRNN